jgi:hypothetical protein
VGECWVAVSVRPVPGAAWVRRAGALRVSGGAPESAGRGRPRPRAGADLAALLAVGAPGEVRLVGIDALARLPGLAEALAVLPGSVRTVVVDGVAFDLDTPLGRACWRLVVAGLAAHVQSRATAKTPAGGSPARAAANTRATSPGPPGAAGAAAAISAPSAGSPGIQARWAGQRQPRSSATAVGEGEESALIAGTPHPAALGGGTRRLGRRAAGGAEDGEHAGQHPRQIGQQRDVDLDAERRAGEVEGQAPARVDRAGRRGVRPDACGKLPGDRAPDGGRSAVAVPVSPGKCPGKGVRGATRYIRTRLRPS